MTIGEPTYYTRHPDDTYSVADPQPSVRPVKQEPVAWSQQRKRNLIKHWAFDCDWGDLTEREIDDLELIINAVLNAAPVRTKDLTDDELSKLHSLTGLKAKQLNSFARAVIAAYKEKNRV